MPKLKTNKSVKKRFIITPKGKVTHHKASKRHLLCHKSSVRKRQLRSIAKVPLKKEQEAVKKLLPYDR